MPQAFIFDMNGTMIDDMHYHEQAWYDVLVNQLKAPLTVEQVRHQIYGTAAEMFDRVFGVDAFSAKEVETITLNKERKYREEFLPHLKLIAGLNDFLIKAKAKHVPLAIGTAAPLLNINFVLDNLKLRDFFPVVIGPDDVKKSKPDPEVFLKAASQLGVASEHCIVFEDAPKGIEAAARAGMKAIAVTSYHTAAELQNKNVLFTIEDYTHPDLWKLL
ncbi:MAG TPA: HAD family phosphatase [Cyclobacteriaceae bacterium]|jgi:beta-phosphoglucomutase family hydrolase|nr:HAD family phosphatase [Cyclobacteriaceae bacterium]